MGWRHGQRWKVYKCRTETRWDETLLTKVTEERECVCVCVRVIMMCKLFLFFALLLSVLEPLLGRPLIHSAEMTYGRPGKCSHLLSFTQAKVQQVICYISCSPVVLVEEEQVVSPDDLSYSKQAYLSQGAAGFGYPALITGDISSDGQRFISICSSLKLAVKPQGNFDLMLSSLI